MYNDPSSIVPVHPLACVSFEKLQEGWPRDLGFVPSELLKLYDAMLKGRYYRLEFSLKIL